MNEQDNKPLGTWSLTLLVTASMIGAGVFTTSGFVQFAVTQRMVPSSRLLLFYVRDDLETVADNLQIDVEDKLENEVIRHLRSDSQ